MPLQVEAWEVYDLKDELLGEFAAEEEAINAAKARAQEEQVRATWHSREGRLVGEADYSTATSRMQEPGAGAIEKALAQGLELHADTSGSGLRVVTVEQVIDPENKAKNKVVAHASHYSLDIALAMVAQELASGRKPKAPRYLTGTTSATSRLDDWVLQGNSLMATADRDGVLIRLYGLEHKTREGKLVWGTLVKVGSGKDFFEACLAALDAPEAFIEREEPEVAKESPLGV